MNEIGPDVEDELAVLVELGLRFVLLFAGFEGLHCLEIVLDLFKLLIGVVEFCHEPLFYLSDQAVYLKVQQSDFFFLHPGEGRVQQFIQMSVVTGFFISGLLVASARL